MTSWLLQLIGIIAIGYVIARLILRIPIIKKFLVYRCKESIDRTSDPKPIIDADNFEISENIVGNSDPVKDFNKRKYYPLDDPSLNMPSSPITQKTDNPTCHGKSIINRGDTKCK
jgi:hypothetical protein